ncbi:NfeD family protein [Mycoplasma sp. 1654_15]|uniref:NfeD family protein n=1 Tax=Mycoplasma sp. 1654_15 TaxID=2725994 RepID=UPI001448AC69|nr:NfeD family protein [Mycoplasma sp. 1654_15]QJB70971.1 NfeD family protein [Mycoplasma sp. 1654_15]
MDFLTKDYSTFVVMAVLWAIIFLIFLIVELLTTGVWSGLISVSTIIPFILAITTDGQGWSVTLQLILFIVLFLILYFSLFKFLKRIFNKTKYDGPVLELFDLDPIPLTHTTYEKGFEETKYGQINVQGKIYRTLSEKGQGTISEGTFVKIVRIEGTTLIVKKAIQKGE